MGKIYSNHLHFLSYLLKCPVDNAGNGKEFGACPQTVIPPTSNRLRTSSFFPLRTPSKSYATPLYINDLRGNKNHFELAGGSSYRGFELPRVNYSNINV